jgi:adenylate cyclase
MRIRSGFQLSITALFVAVVLGVGFALIYLSFDRAMAISRSAATTFIDRVAEHTAERIDGQFREVLRALEVVRQLPAIKSGATSDNSRLYEFLAALLRNHRQLYNLYVGYDDGRFLQLDLLDQAGLAIRAQLDAPPQAEFRLTIIEKYPKQDQRTRITIYLSPSLQVVAQEQRDADYDPRGRP